MTFLAIEYTFTKNTILQLVPNQYLNVFFFYCCVCQCGNSSCCFCNLTWILKERMFGRWCWVRVTAGGEWPAFMFYMTASRVHAHFIHSDLVDNFCPWSSYHCQDGAVQYSTINTLIAKYQVEALVFESLYLLNNFKKNPISNMLHSVESFAGWSSGWVINSWGWEEAASLWPQCSGITTFLCSWYYRLASYKYSEMQILWSNKVMQTRLCGLDLVCAA